MPFSLLWPFYSMCILSLTWHYTFITKQILWLLIGTSKDYQLPRRECRKRDSRRKFGIVWWDSTVRQGDVIARFGKGPCSERREQRETEFRLHWKSTREDPYSILQNGWQRAHPVHNEALSGSCGSAFLPFLPHFSLTYGKGAQRLPRVGRLSVG